MSDWVDHSFEIVKQTDKAICDAMHKVFESSPYPCTRVQLKHSFANGRTTFERIAEIYTDGLLSVTLDQNGELLGELKFQFASCYDVEIKRGARSADMLTVHLQNTKALEKSEGPNIIRFVSMLRQHLHPVDSVAELHSLLGKEVAEHYQKREAELGRLEQLSINVTEDVAKYRHKLDEEHETRRKVLESEWQHKKDLLDATAEKREQSLDQREQEFAAQQAEFDRRESRYARRDIRKELKEQLAERNKSFVLTAGTRKLRLPILVFTGILLVLFGAGAAGFAYLSVKGTDSAGAATGLTAMLWIRQALFGVAFISTAVFFLRWSNRWFDQHAQAEFRQKQFELDLDRASWLVEMAMEWQTEKGSDIPAPLVDRLAHGLFESRQKYEKPLHPADQLASAILGAASTATMKIPGGGEICLDRKGVKRLSNSEAIGDEGQG